MFSWTRTETEIAVSWLLVACLVAAGAVGLRSGAYPMAVFALLSAGLAAAPAVFTRERRATLPWPVVGLAAVAALGQRFTQFDGVATYVWVVAVTLILVVDLQAFTDVEMSSRFSAAFVTTTTMAVGAVWTVLRWVSDAFFGTSYLGGVDPVMWELVGATVVGVVVGVAFEYGFHGVIDAGVERRLDRGERR
ncbi:MULTISPECIES: hypothetical protein [Haloprofundus]|uniref:hypothetical protein n=1 Tax=Haloprofundus TaxID=1911573 RepID=UPI000E45276B|nr:MULTISPECIES: hypothetical protein [Haloprofundus]QCJ46977.1 hypothetical protein FCF25_07575 [Haloprofundus sp. MHR1]